MNNIYKRENEKYTIIIPEPLHCKGSALGKPRKVNEARYFLGGYTHRNEIHIWINEDQLKNTRFFTCR